MYIILTYEIEIIYMYQNVCFYQSMYQNPKTLLIPGEFVYVDLCVDNIIICWLWHATVCFSDSQLNLLSSSDEVQNFLGEGSFGKVVKCVHTVSNTEVPIKKIEDKPVISSPVIL